jgi:hypothetical protein
MRHEVLITEGAERDLEEIHGYISLRGQTRLSCTQMTG